MPRSAIPPTTRSGSTARELRAKAIGEGANLAITQAGRIEFAARGGRINTDFIDNCAGVDCSDNEVNIKIPLNREMAEGRLSARGPQRPARRDDRRGRRDSCSRTIGSRRWPCRSPSAAAPPACRRWSGRSRSSRRAAGSTAPSRASRSNEDLMRRAQENRGLTRPELAILLSTSKMALQAAIESGKITEDPTLTPELCAAFPETMQARHGDAILAAPPAPRDHRHQDRQPLRQPPRHHRALRARRGGRRLVRPGRGRLRRGRAAVRHAGFLGAARHAPTCPSSFGSNCSTRPARRSSSTSPTSCATPRRRPSSPRWSRISRPASTRSTPRSKACSAARWRARRANAASG